jgi:putative Mg2+ transporter-C (MgtC) family protein
VSEYELIGRVGLAFVLCFVIGFERELRGAPAGDRTFSLVGTAAAAVTAVTVGTSPQAIGGVVTGVGFIGAGLVLRGDGGMIRGVTSAAAVFAATCIGVVAGTGHPGLAAFVAVLSLVVLELRYIPLLDRFDGRRYAGRLRDDMAPPRPRGPA